MANCAVLLQVELDKRGIVLPKTLMVHVSKNEIVMSTVSVCTIHFVLLQPLGNEEHTIFRFLKARKMNVEAAADMLQSKCLQITVFVVSTKACKMKPTDQRAY